VTLLGRGAVVTGGGRGIGAAVAEALAGAGASVVVAARGRKEIEAEAAALRRRGLKAWAHPCDVTKPASVKALAAFAHTRLGAVHILVNNAGIAPSAPIARLTLAEWNRVLAVNATGTFLCTRAFLPGMLSARWGRVINVASTAGKTGGPYLAAYAASKHAVLGFTRCAAVEVAAKGVTVNAVCPGYVDTDLTAGTLARIMAKTGMTKPKALEALLSQSPQRRLIAPEEVAWLALSLCDVRAKGINGQAIILDGGGVTV
jgi:NAD(P)-dependent dehydrogenase (short-subunit alcohol dehydrogenase family)